MSVVIPLAVILPEANRTNVKAARSFIQRPAVAAWAQVLLALWYIFFDELLVGVCMW